MLKYSIIPTCFALLLFTGCGALSNLSIPNVDLNNTGLSELNSLKPLSQTEATSGLKEALIEGITSGTTKLQKSGSFSQNIAYKILLPTEIQSIEQKIRGNVLLNAAIGKELDNTIDAMNKGAEMAMSRALPIFKKSVQNMGFNDALNILTGGKGAATQFLKINTSDELSMAFQPEIKAALESVAIAQYWNPVVTAINKNKKLLGLSADIQPNLEQYVTEKSMSALFTEIAVQENLIRENPIARGTELLRRVFDYADKNK